MDARFAPFIHIAAKSEPVTIWPQRLRHALYERRSLFNTDRVETAAVEHETTDPWFDGWNRQYIDCLKPKVRNKAIFNPHSRHFDGLRGHINPDCFKTLSGKPDGVGSRSTSDFQYTVASRERQFLHHSHQLGRHLVVVPGQITVKVAALPILGGAVRRDCVYLRC